jgi:hypothetical protein
MRESLCRFGSQAGYGSVRADVKTVVSCILPCCMFVLRSPAAGDLRIWRGGGKKVNENGFSITAVLVTCVRENKFNCGMKWT